jgi:hypothetical protein
VDPPTGCQHAEAAARHLQAAFLDILPRIQTHAQIHFRHLRCPGKRDDAIQEVTALAWKWFVRLAEQGKDVNEFVSAVAEFAVRHVRSGRKLCGQERARDVMSPVAQRNAGFRVERLPSSFAAAHESLYGDPHGQDALDALEERLRDNTQTPVFDQVVFRCDFRDWLAGLPERTRRIVDELMAGEGTGDVAGKFGLSPGRVSQMRRELMLGWRRFGGEVH